MRVILPAELDDRVEDAVTEGIGGFRNKHALIAAAVDAYLVDLLAVNDAVGLQRTPRGDLRPRQPEDGLPRVKSVGRGPAVVDDVSVLTDEPLLGLHNRDWPSLWALGVLAEETTSGPISWRGFLLEVTSRAWHVADDIAAALPAAARKATALLPTNRDKAQSAEAAFQSFAIADVSRRSMAGKVAVAGPLPLWRGIGFTRSDHELVVGLTESGWDLLERTAGLAASAPHGPDEALLFFEYLREHSSADWWGFDTMLQLVRDARSREEYLAGFRSARQWKASVADSAAQGYLARGREWGLVEPRMADGRYELTEFGREFARA